jgi:hypothetical protein
MTDFHRMIMRQGGAGAGGGSGRRRRASKGPRLVAHVCDDWSDSLVERHIAGCRDGLDPATGQWDLAGAGLDVIWAYLFESLGTLRPPRPDGSLDWGAWGEVIREIELS